MPELNKISCVLMRGGTSKGPLFLRNNLPEKIEDRDKLLLSIMGSPHPLQVDGLGGSQPQSSKVAIVNVSDRPDADVDYLFAQVSVDKCIVDTNANCGNMLAAVGPYAIEQGLVNAQKGLTTVRIYNVNTKTIVHSDVQTPEGKVTYLGNFTLDGVPGSSAPVRLNFFNAEGAKTGSFFPTGKTSEIIDGIPVTLVDYSMPMLLIPANSFDLSGYEHPNDIDNSDVLLARIERMRQEAGRRMGLGDVSDKVIPKVALLSAPAKGGTITSRYLMPWNCHKSHAITGAMCLASTCYVEGTVTSQLLNRVMHEDDHIVIEHPTGKIDLDVFLDKDSPQKIKSIGVLRSARPLFEGNVYAMI